MNSGALLRGSESRNQNRFHFIESSRSLELARVRVCVCECELGLGERVWARAYLFDSRQFDSDSAFERVWCV